MNIIELKFLILKIYRELVKLFNYKVSIWSPYSDFIVKKMI